ncbi:MAG TPA: hypothetical protein VHL58_16550 [Thermoanaerobaculia bacterium]|nr:hypothetical protein [Thermoanaerobaculia bacterium]
MHPRDIDGLLVALERARRLAPDADALIELLATLDGMDMPDVERLARFHDALLFLCAYPATPRILKRAESMMKRFGRRVTALAGRRDFDPLLDPEISGIAGTAVKVVFSYDFVRWLASRFPEQVEIDWEPEPEPERLASVLPLFVPLLEEEASVEANVPYPTWLKAARALAKDGGLAWLIRHLEGLPLPAHHRATLYDALGLWILWRLGNSSATRTAMRHPPPTIFYQQTAPLGRREVSIARELAGRPLRIARLFRQDGEAVLDMARAAMGTRYRELYGFTYGDPATILSADCGRGLEILLIGIVREKRLPLRAGFAPLLLRNGVPVGYGDAFGFCERMEVSLNIFYAFRDGESAFCLAMLLKLYHQLFGSTSFSIDPYQIGMENDEAIESGAFWFYRKLGFRCTNEGIERLARREEERMAKKPGHRTSARLLRRMARGSLLWEQPDVSGTAAGARRASEWDHFHIRNIGIAVQKVFAQGGHSAAEFQESMVRPVAAALRIKTGSLSAPQRRAMARLAPALAAIPDLKRWSTEERHGVSEIIRAKAGHREQAYLQLLARHRRLRRALIDLGSSGSGQGRGRRIVELVGALEWDRH